MQGYHRGAAAEAVGTQGLGQPRVAVQADVGAAILNGEKRNVISRKKNQFFRFTSLKQMIVTAAQAIMTMTQKTKKTWRILSRREHSGKRQWEIWRKKIFFFKKIYFFLLNEVMCMTLTTNFLCLRY